VASKRKLVELVRTRYADIAQFNEAWAPARPLASFEALAEEPLSAHTDAARADMRAFLRSFLEAYFGLLVGTLRKYDTQHLVLGSRFTQATASDRDVVEVSARFVDVVSVNYYRYPIDRSFLERVHRWSGDKPVMLSEWYVGSRERGLSAVIEVEDQGARARAYRHYVEQAAALPFVVGFQWFIYNDQALTGRFFQGLNGEGNNTGLVSVTDRPYEQLVTAASTSARRIYPVMFGELSPYAPGEASDAR
jgi:hypothetical protein